MTAARIAALASGEELIDAETFAAVFSRTDEAPPRRACGDDPARLEAEIDACASRSEATRLGARLAARYAEAAVVFAVRRGVVHGVAGEGCAGRPETALFPKAMPSVYARAAIDRESFRGAPPERTLERRVLRALGREDVHEMAVLPVVVGGRVAALLYADNGREPLGDAALAALGDVARRLGRAYERLIVARKRACA